MYTITDGARARVALMRQCWRPARPALRGRSMSCMKRFCHETQSHDWLQHTLILSLRLYSPVIVEDGGGKRASTAVRCVTHGLDGAGGRGGSVRQRRDGGEIKAARDERVHGLPRRIDTPFCSQALITNQCS